MVDLFKRLDAGRPPPAEAAIKQSRNNLEPTQKLLDWLQQHWAKPTISARDIYKFGPNSIRDPKKAIGLAEILVGHGWLIPNKTRRHDMREWRIVRGPSGYPIVATVTTAAGMEARPAPSQSG
jgi:hypothetical protein